MKPKHIEQQQAKDMYLHTTLSRNDILQVLNIDRKTLYNWIKDGDWIRLKYISAYSPTALVEQYYKQLHEMNKFIASRQVRPFANKEEAEIIKKLTTTIRNINSKRQPVGDTIKSFMELSTNVNRRDEDTAKKLVMFMDEYIKERVKDTKFDEDFLLQREEAQFDVSYAQMLAEEDAEEIKRAEEQAEKEQLITMQSSPSTSETQAPGVTPSPANGEIVMPDQSTLKPFPNEHLNHPKQHHASPHFHKKHPHPNYPHKKRAA